MANWSCGPPAVLCSHILFPLGSATELLCGRWTQTRNYDTKLNTQILTVKK